MTYEKKDVSTSRKANDVWPPQPLLSEPEINKAPVGGYLLTGMNWLDAVLGIPSGFMIGFALWGIAGLLVQEVVPPPSHRPQVLTIWAIGATLSAITYLLVARRYSLFAITMWIGALPFYLLLLFLAWCIP